jgi:hypothetical protein
MKFLSARRYRVLIWALFALVLVYAFVAGLRTVSDFDVGWLLATGRYLVSHRQVPRTDVLSYTAYGVPWIYPPFGGASFYLAYALGGFAALSWIGALASAAVVAIAVGRPRPLTCGLAILAVPSIAFRTAPRADLFTTLFFASFLALLVKYRRDGEAGLWLLPLVMLVWVNVHSGFSAGVALLGVYVAIELVDLCFAVSRADAARRLRGAAPWLAAALLATAINPWGIGIYRALAAHNKLAEFQSGVPGEWSAMRLTPASLAGALQLRDPNSGYWWLLFLAGVAALVALSRRQLVYAMMLAGAGYFSVQHVRFQALFAIVVIIISAEVFSRRTAGERKQPWLTAAATIAIVALSTLATLHTADAISNRSYFANGEFSTFGAGLSWWYPQGAAAFIENNSLPGQIFSDYNSSGYLTLRLGPRYPDFADGRGIPFPVEVLLEQATLQQSSPDSAEWKRAEEQYGINTIVLSLSRSGGLEYVPLQQYCASRQWQPVYLDDVSIVLVRRRPENESLIERFAVNCTDYAIGAPFAGRMSHSDIGRWGASERARLFEFYANTASIYYVLGRDHDALDAANRAEYLFAADPGLPMLIGQVLQADGKLPEAEAQYRRSLQIRPTDMGWFLLGRALVSKKDYAGAAAALERSAEMSVSPASRYRLLANVDLALNRPDEALAALDRAEYFEEKLSALPAYPAAAAQIAEGRGRAWLELHDPRRARPYLEKSTHLAPDATRWNLLAECYDEQGLVGEAADARNHAKELMTSR